MAKHREVDLRRLTSAQAAAAHNRRGLRLARQGNLDEAAACFREVVRYRPDRAEGYISLGVLRCWQRDFRAGAAAYRQVVRLRPDWPEAHTDLGKTLRCQGKWAAAEASFRRALRLQPDHAEAHRGLGILFFDQARLDEAQKYLEHAVQLRPPSAEAHFTLAFLHLCRGDFQRGWAEFEWRSRTKSASGPLPQLRRCRQPRWDGTPLRGRRILLHAEWGLGDTLHFIRYAALVRQRGGRVLVACQPRLLGLVESCPGIDTLVGVDAPLPAFDVHASLLSLPYLLGTTLDTVPANVPYLAADAQLVERWRRELSPIRAFKIGIVWQGNPDHRGDQLRSMTLAHFAPLARVPGVRLFSLQKGAGSEQLRTAAFPVADLGSRLDEDTGPFQDTAAVLANLDLVITADTSMAHLAGALGVPVWVALHFVPDFRWMLEREDTPWYPSMRLFRQSAPGAWEPVFQRLAGAVRKLAAQGRKRGALGPAAAVVASK